MLANLSSRFLFWPASPRRPGCNSWEDAFECCVYAMALGLRAHMRSLAVIAARRNPTACSASLSSSAAVAESTESTDKCGRLCGDKDACADPPLDVPLLIGATWSSSIDGTRAPFSRTAPSSEPPDSICRAPSSLASCSAPFESNSVVVSGLRREMPPAGRAGGSGTSKSSKRTLRATMSASAEWSSCLPGAHPTECRMASTTATQSARGIFANLK